MSIMPAKNKVGGSRIEQGNPLDCEHLTVEGRREIKIGQKPQTIIPIPSNPKPMEHSLAY